MLAVNYSSLRNNLKEYLDRVTDDCDTLLITRKADHNVVAMSEDSHENIKEVLYLLESFGNHQWLVQAMQQFADGSVQAVTVEGTEMQALFSENAWQDYSCWQAQDTKSARKVETLLRDIAADGTAGRPRPLQGDLRGCWSRRITERDRLIYRVTADSIQVLACRYHDEQA